MQHRIVERGADTCRIHRIAGAFACVALLPFAISLGLDMFVVFDRSATHFWAVLTGAAFFALAILFWYLLGLALRLTTEVKAVREVEEPTPLATRVEQMLTEARVILPGSQALLGFQLAVTFTHSFSELGSGSKFIHLSALCCVALSVIFLMTPAALHRIAFQGEDSEAFLRWGSVFVTLAPGPLAVGLSLDLQVAIAQAIQNETLATVAAVAAFVVLTGLWYILPLFLRLSARVPGTPSSVSPSSSALRRL